MTRSTEERIEDILASVDRCRRYADLLDSDDKVLADMANDAIERNLQIIGEASNRLPPELTEAYAQVAWPAIRGMRNILVHEYFGVDPAIVRDVIDSHLVPLSAALRERFDG